MSPWIQYKDFVIRLRRSGSGYQVEALAPNGNVEASHPSSKKLWKEIRNMVAFWHKDFDLVLILGSTQIARQLELEPRGSPSPELKRVWDRMQAALTDVENILRQVGWQDARTIGQKLREFLLPKTSEVWRQFEKILKDAEGEGKHLRLRLVIEAEELLELPWEYLYIKEFDPFGFLAADGSISIVRQPSLDYHTIKLPRTNQLRISVVAPSPKGWKPLKVGEELQRLRTALEELEEQGKISLDILKPCGPKNLQDKLEKEDFHIIHYIGHAFYNSSNDRFIPDLEPGAWLVLESETGEAEYLKVEDLASWLQGKAVRLVVFNACETARQEVIGQPSGDSQNFYSAAQTLVQCSDVAIAVAMQFRMPDDSAPHFAEVFYRSLAAAMPVDACVGASRALLSGRFGISRPDWGIPAVITSSEDLCVYAPGDEVLDAIAPQLTELPGSRAGNTFQNKGHVEKKLVELDVAGERRKVLKLRFYLHSEGAYGGWMIQLEGPRFDATPYSRVRLKLAGAQGGERVEIKFKSHRIEYVETLGKEIDLEEEEAYIPQGLPGPGIRIEKGWQEVIIPLNSVNIDWSHLRVITVATNDVMLRSFLERELPGEETIYIAEVRFEGEKGQG